MVWIKAGVRGVVVVIEPTEMEMRVAKALAEFQYGNPSAKPGQDHIEEARVAIRAMREPNYTMLKKAVRADATLNNANYSLVGADAISIWRSMVDAASPLREITATPFRLRPENEIPPRSFTLAKPE